MLFYTRSKKKQPTFKKCIRKTWHGVSCFGTVTATADRFFLFSLNLAFFWLTKRVRACGAEAVIWGHFAIDIDLITLFRLGLGL